MPNDAIGPRRWARSREARVLTDAASPGRAGGPGRLDTRPMTPGPATPRNRKVQVTLSKYDYDAVRRAAERTGGSVAEVVREAVQEYCVKPDRKRQKLAALDALREYAESADPAELLPPPEDWEAWEREYRAMKAGRNRGMTGEEAEAIADSPDEGTPDE